MATRHLIIAPPPTPNGDLHLGHLAGPYLAADVYKRHLAQHGIDAMYVVSTDDNQSYVDSTARRLGVNRTDLVAESRRQIRSALETYSIDIDHFGDQDDGYTSAVTEFFEALWREGLIGVEEVNVARDPRDGTYPVEAFIAGRCPSCFDRASGGVCESCGHPNAGWDLLAPDRADIVTTREVRLVFDLERYGPRLEAQLFKMTHRPALHHLIRELMEKPLRPFLLSYKTGRGISTAFAGLPDQELNVWAEMFVGHMYFLESVCPSLSREDEYVQFFGFDNSYFYVLLHMALMLAARDIGRDWPAPRTFITNQFYNLDAAKFSTSRGHLVWARDLAERYDSDVVRLYLCEHAPEYQESTFNMSIFERTVEEMVSTINGLVDLYNDGPSESEAKLDRCPAWLTDAIGPRQQPESFSMKLLVRRALNCLQLLKELIQNGEKALLPLVPATIVLCLEPFCPRYAARVRTQLELPDSVTLRAALPMATGKLPAFPLAR